MTNIPIRYDNECTFADDVVLNDFELALASPKTVMCPKNLSSCRHFSYISGNCDISTVICEVIWIRQTMPAAVFRYFSCAFFHHNNLLLRRCITFAYDLADYFSGRNTSFSSAVRWIFTEKQSPWGEAYPFILADRQDKRTNHKVQNASLFLALQKAVAYWLSIIIVILLHHSIVHRFCALGF